MSFKTDCLPKTFITHFDIRYLIRIYFFSLSFENGQDKFIFFFHFLGIPISDFSNGKLSFSVLLVRNSYSPLIMFLLLFSYRFLWFQRLQFDLSFCFENCIFNDLPLSLSGLENIFVFRMK